MFRSVPSALSLALVTAVRGLALGWLLLVPAAAAGEGPTDADSLEQQLQTIETVNQQAPWRESAALIDQFGARRLELSDRQRYRLELVEARNFALAGDYARSLAVTESLLARPAATELRIRALTLAINVSTNVSDYPRAYAWIEEGLGLLDEVDTPQPRLLGIASYVYLRAGEERLALDYAAQALEASRSGSLRDQCVALSDYAIALDETGRPAEAEGYSREQIATCRAANDPVFVADAHKGVGRALLAQQLHIQAIPWLSEARKQFEATGFRSGYLETGIHLAKALLHSGGSTVRARELIDEALPVFEAQQARASIEDARLLLSTILERDGRPAEALAQLRLAQEAHRFLDEDARKRRLGYLQLKFDSQAKERRISALQQERAQQAAAIDAHSRADWLQWLGLASLALLAALLVMVLRRTALERRRYRELSERDGLTGLYNHQSTLRLGSALLRRSLRDRRPFTAIVADIDGFKQINDRFGHAAGDAVLRNLGQHLRDVFPHWSVVGRSGGEEFTMLVDTSREQAQDLIEDLRRRTGALTVEDVRIDYSLSYGLCETDGAASSLEDLLRRADMALYRAKRNGRNQVIDATEVPPEARSELAPGLIREAREAGFSARMEPGLGLEACLYTDRVIDPGRSGVLSLDAGQLLDEDRLLDRRILLLVRLAKPEDDAGKAAILQPLMDRLLLDYPGEHEITLYQPARHAGDRFRSERLALRELGAAECSGLAALVVPPCAPHQPDLTARRLQPARIPGA